MIKRILLTIPILLLAISLNAQGYLHLKKIGRVGGGIRIPIGEEVRFKLKDDDEFTRGVLIDFVGDSTLRFYKGNVNLHDIEIVDISRRVRNWEWKIAIAGGVYMTFDVVNGAIQGNGYEFNQGVWVPAVVMVGVAVIIHLVKPKKWRVNHRRRIFMVRE